MLRTVSQSLVIRVTCSRPCMLLFWLFHAVFSPRYDGICTFILMSRARAAGIHLTSYMMADAALPSSGKSLRSLPLGRVNVAYGVLWSGTWISARRDNLGGPPSYPHLLQPFFQPIPSTLSWGDEYHLVPIRGRGSTALTKSAHGADAEEFSVRSHEEGVGHCTPQ